jgi:hypothetical protein
LLACFETGNKKSNPLRKYKTERKKENSLLLSFEGASERERGKLHSEIVPERRAKKQRRGKKRNVRLCANIRCDTISLEMLD